MLSDRYKSNDQFWFSCYYEAGHLVLHGRKLMFVELGGVMHSDLEDAANRFAADSLIPRADAARLQHLPHRKAAVEQFAR